MKSTSQRKVFRFAPSGLLAVAMTFCLFLTMTLLVKEGEMELSTPTEPIEILFRKPIDEPPHPVRTILERPERETEIIEKPTVDFGRNKGHTLVRFKVPKDPAVEPTLNPSEGSGTLLPIYDVRPEYPSGPIHRGIEGEAVVEFTVTAFGTVADCIVVDYVGSPSFGRAACRALERAKYKPRTVGGEPVDTKGLQRLYTFNFDDNA